MLYGREATVPIDIDLPVIQEPMAADIRRCLEDVHAGANARIVAQHNAIMARDNRPMVEYAKGDFVLVFNPAGKLGKATKLLSRWYGPYRVVRQTSPVNYVVETQGLGNAN